MCVCERERKGERRREIYSYMMHGEKQTHIWTVSRTALHDKINKIRWCLKLGRGGGNRCDESCSK